MAQKLEFIEKARAPGANISALCRDYGISRQTGHKWLRRYHERGYGGLVEQSRRPHTSPLTTGEDIVVGILELREQHATWGPDKISRVLGRSLGDDAPSKSTVARVLQRVGRIKRRRPRVRLWSVEGRPYVEVKAPNDLWTIDIKGWWRARNGEKCEPLTVRDACSRKVLAVTLLARTRTEDVRRVLQELFLRHGLPAAIQCDNGSPFVCTRARGGLSALSAWLISLGIRLVRSRPGCPQDNGGHERMHRDLAELELRPARSRRAQQRLCDRWMLDFNEIRPHDALGSKTPSEVYRDSERRSLTPLVPSYPPEWTTRRVSRTGNVCVNGDSVFISMSVARQVVGLRQESVLRWRVLYFGVDLGTIEIAPIRDAVTDRGSPPVSTTVSPLNSRPPTLHRRGSTTSRSTLSASKRRALPPSKVSDGMRRPLSGGVRALAPAPTWTGTTRRAAMRDPNAVFVGCDVGDKTSELCVLDADGAVVDRRQVRTTAGALTKALGRYTHTTVVIEVGTHSRWIEEVLTSGGHRVVVANARQVQLIWKRRKKTDKADALLLARLARVDLSLLAPVQHRSRRAQIDLAAIRSRDLLVHTRVRLVNHIRGALKPLGVKPVECSTQSFTEQIEEQIPTELMPALAPVLEVLRTLNQQIAAHDRQIEQLAAACATTKRLAEVDSVGALTALTFRLTIEDPAKFKKSRIVAAFLGLTPAKDQSGDSDPQKRISKAGDPLLRKLLVQCAHHLLGHRGHDCDIRRWGLSLAERGGKHGKKRAVVAVARKLAVVLHRVWVSGEAYQPFHTAAVMAG